MLNLPHIAFETTDRCNLDCVYCYNIWKTDAVERTPFNSYQKAIGTLKQLFSTTDIQYVAFTGGEPFLSERFAEVILYCRMEGKQVTLISNGTKGTEKDYKRLIKLGVGLFEFPIHSAHAEIHD
ncbi:MAG: radical SAM protein, partial [Bacteroidota bacterium]|nr:radical SAM protein [Bacteroidota bacterium]